jgi:hypothetical protein
MNIFKIKFNNNLVSIPKTLKELFGDDKVEVMIRLDDWYIKAHFRAWRLSTKDGIIRLDQYDRNGLYISHRQYVNLNTTDDKPRWHIYNKGDEDKYDE